MEKTSKKIQKVKLEVNQRKYQNSQELTQQRIRQPLTKNVAKIFDLKCPPEFRLNKAIQEFIQTKKKSYNRAHFNKLITDPNAKQLLIHFLEDHLYVELAMGNRKEEPKEMIQCIRAYLKGIEMGDIQNQRD